MPKLSVILPVYNSEKYVGQAIESILNQTYTDYEFIIIDDGSKDASLSVVESFKDPRIRVFGKSNSGLADTLNYGINRSEGEVIARMDNDDIALPDRLLIQMRSFSKETAVLGGQVDLLDSNGTISKGPRFPTGHEDILERLLCGKSSIIHSTVLINKELALKAGCYDDRSSAEDLDLWLRISKMGKLENVQNIVLHLRKHDQSMTVLMHEKHILDHIIAILYYKKGGSHTEIPEDEFEALKEQARNIIEEESYISKLEEFTRQKNNYLNGNIFHKIKYLLQNPSFLSLYNEILKTRKRIFVKNH